MIYEIIVICLYYEISWIIKHILFVFFPIKVYNKYINLNKVDIEKIHKNIFLW